MSITGPSSSRTSRFSAKSKNVDYYQLAQELIDGKPPVTITARDLRGVLISLSVLRSEATTGGHHDLSHAISEIVKELNLRVRPPSTRSARSVSTRETQTSETKTQSKRSANPNPAEYQVLLAEVNAMLEQPAPDVPESEAERFQLLKVIENEVTVAVKQFDLTRVQALHELEDKVKHISRPRISDVAIKRSGLVKDLATQRTKEQEIVEHITLQKQENEKIKKAEIAKSEAEFDTELEKIRQNPPEIDSKWTAALLALWDSEQRYAKARDYEAVKAIHAKAEEQKQKEIEKREERQRTKRDRLLEEKKAEHTRNKRIMEDRLDLIGTEKLHPDEQELQKVRTTIRSLECDLHAMRKAK
jgi:hypothetical protein